MLAAPPPLLTRRRNWTCVNCGRNNDASVSRSIFDFASRGWVRAAVLAAGGFLACFAALAAPPRYFVRSWQSEDGLPQNSVTALAQTREGYLWIGTLAGLVRFDGERFVIFDTDNAPELKNGRITSLHEDADGVLWIGHETGDVTRLAEGRFAAETLPAAWQRDVVTSIAKDRQGDLWVHSRMGRLARLRDGLVLPPGDSVIDGYGLSALTRDSAGELWVTRGGQLHRVQDGQLIPAAQPPATPTNFVQALCHRRAGGLWVMRGGQLYAFDQDAWHAVTNTPPNLTTTTRLRETRAGEVIVSTIDRGLWLVPPAGDPRNFSRTNGLSANWVADVVEDREGNLWVGTASGGLNVLSATEFEVWEPPDRWNGMPVLSVATSVDDTLWIGTEGAGLYRLRDGEWTRYSSELPSKFVWSVAPDKTGRIWAGTWGGGLLQQAEDQFVVPSGMEQFKTPITALLHGSSNVVWLGTRSGLRRFQAGVVQLVGSSETAAVQDVRAIAEDAAGTIWFGIMGGGLGCYSNGVVRQYRMADGLPSDFILTLSFSDPSTLWIGTSGGGLARLRDGKFSHLGVRHGLPSSIIMHLQYDTFGDCWLSTANGIFRVSTNQLEACANGLRPRLSGVTYGMRDGLPTMECSGGFQPAGCQTRDGRLWFPTRKGLVSIRPSERAQQDFAPAPLIEEVWADGRKLWGLAAGNASDTLPKIELPAGVQRFDVAYTALGLSHPERLHFRYRLKDLDADWVEAGRKRTASYSHPPPGRYVFEVQVTDYAGNWTPASQSVTLNALPFFWQTWWFQVCAYAIGAASVAMGVGLGLRRRQRRKLELMARQQELERERTRIARDIHDDLGASLTRISMLSQPAPNEVQSTDPQGNRLELIYGTTRELIRAMDEIVWAVNPEHDTLDSVANYLARFAQAHFIPAGIRCRLNLPIEVPASRVRAEVRHNLFLAFKEASHNILKHAKATEVHFALELYGHSARFRLEDNGVGLANAAAEGAVPFGSDRIASGLGTASMKERLAAVGGSCVVEAGKIGGTAVHFSIPLDSAAATGPQSPSPVSATPPENI